MRRQAAGSVGIVALLLASSVAAFGATQPSRDSSTLMSRRNLLGSLVGSAVLGTSLPAQAEVFVRETNQLRYTFQPPSNFEPGNKPLKTHLDEINFKSQSTSGYQFGITVDPVRIDSLRQFGTPEEVAAKVVLAEVNRDGVFDVTLMKDPVEVDNSYVLNYLSEGKRGKKRFVTKFCIQSQKLYALTAQCKEENYPELEKEMMAAVESFRVP